MTDKADPRARGLFFVLSGPSGAGKDAVMDTMRLHGFPIRFVVTCTTRPPRDGEAHGRDYFFVSNEQFDRMVAEDDLLEWAMVHGRHYGVPRSQVRDVIASGEHILARVDVQGAAAIRQKVPEAVLIFLAPPSLDVLGARLEQRNTETPEERAIRLRNAEEEWKRLPEFDYVVINRDGHLDEAVEKVEAIIEAESCRVRRRQVKL